MVTGVNGFVGHHVARELHRQGLKAVGVSNQPNLEEDLMNSITKYISCDLTDPEQVSKMDLSDVDAIINLAGFAKVGDSKGRGDIYNRVNVGVHAVLYEECLRQNVAPRIIAVSTGTVYDPEQPMPLTEESRLASKSKANEYIVSKQLMEETVVKFNDRGLRCLIVRPLNHSGPGQLPGFLLPDLGTQLQESSKQGKPLKVGNLNTKRDYTDVRDVARAYVELATCDEDKLKHDVYNICTGKSIPGSEILGLLADSFGVKEVKTEVDPSKIRTNDIMDIYGSRDRITTDIGWEPEISVKQMVKDYVEWKKST